MATNLTPAQMAELQRLFSTPVEQGDGNAYNPNTVNYDGQSWKQDGSGGFAGTGRLFGDNQYNYTNYNPDGSFSAEGEARMSDWDPLQQFLMIAGTMAGGAGLYNAFGAGAGAAGGAGEGLMNGLNGADLMSDAFVANGGVGAGGFGGTSGSYMSNLLGGSGDLGSRVIGGTGAGSTAAGTAASTAASTAAGSGGGLLGKALGIGSTLLGAAAGAKGQEQSSTTARDIPEWLKPYITGQGGLLSQTQQQLAASRSPERMAQWDQMRNVSMGLLNQPIAGNPTTGWTFPR
jgi:hypothetical protein